MPVDPKVAESRATAEDIRACYRLLLGREPDEGGFRCWAEAVFQQRITPPDLALRFLNSPEYRSRQSPAAIPNHVTVSVDGLSLMLPEDDIAWAGLVRGGQYETWVKNKIASTLKAGDWFVDVGCNIGYFSLLAARAVGPAGQVVAIDAAPSNAALSLSNARRNGFANVRVLPAAVSDRIETLVYSADRGQSNKQLYALPDQDLETMQVALALPLDTLLSDLPRLDVIKIDVEGFEHKCVLGAHDLLRRRRPRIAAEYSPKLIRESSGVEGVDFLKHLFELGYRCGILLRDGNVLDCGDDAGRIHEIWQSDLEQYGVAHADLWFEPL